MMDDRYTAVSNPPKDALKEIEFGALRGKSDINPQWKIEAMTENMGCVELVGNLKLLIYVLLVCRMTEEYCFLCR